MSRSTCVLASFLVLGAAAACAQSSPYTRSLDTGNPSPGTDTGADGGTVETDAASPGANGGDDGATGLLPDGSVSLGDAATPTNCTIGAAGAIAVIPLETMAPGLDCGSCHLLILKPLYLAGTVYPTYHEPDLCLGVTGVNVEIVDGAGASHTIAADSSGNFVDTDLLQGWPTPWSVAVVSGSARRAMVGTVTSGDCNSCHTVAGASSAPGRILAPDGDDADGGA